MFKGISSATFKKGSHRYFHSEQQSERDEIDSTLRLDSTCPLFVERFAFLDSIQSGTNHLKTAISSLRKKFLAKRFGL